MNSDYHELMGVSKMLQKTEERVEELEAELENANHYIAELEARDDLRENRVLEGLLTDLEFGFVMNPDDPISHQEFLTRALVEYLRGWGVVRYE